MNTQITTIIQVEGMHCPACQKVIQKWVGKISGVSSVVANLNGKVEILADRTIEVEEVKQILEGTDYKINKSS